MALECPICQKKLPSQSRGAAARRFLPFCSERCKFVDLHAWLETDYRIDAPLDADDIDDIPTN